MKRSEFAALAASKVLVLDGATGTELQKVGLPAGVCPEKWVLENPESIIGVQKAYIAAGSNIVYTCTFGANRLKLADFGLATQCSEMNRKLAALSRQAAEGTGTLVFGDLAPTGQFVEPSGDMPFEEIVDVYREQASALLAGGVDGFVIETMMDLQEARAALLAVRELGDYPVIVTMTYEQQGRTLSGNDPVSCLVALQALGASAVGCNCSSGPEHMAELIVKMKPYARVPLVAKPNAGLPQFKDGKTVFNLGAEEFGPLAAKLVTAGAGLVGGCCGTSPAHLRTLAAAVAGMVPPPVSCYHPGVISGPRSWREISPNGPFTLIGERINPTGKKALQAELREGSLSLVQDFAQEQEDNGADVLDINLGMSGIDEVSMMREAILSLSFATSLPLCFDTTNPQAVEAALRLYPGRALFNSITAETSRLKEILPIAAKYGAMLIILPITDEGIPETLEGRIAAVETILAEAAKYGYGPQDCCVDGLVMAVATNSAAPRLTLGLIRHCAEKLGMNTVCGLSNVSYGLPRRELLNRGFLALAMSSGLNMCIANPSTEGLREIIRTGEALLGRDLRLERYLAEYGKAVPAAPLASPSAADNPGGLVGEAVLRGRIDEIAALVRQALDKGIQPKSLVDDELIPAIVEVGNRYERQEYYLPQLSASAEAMRQAMEVISPLLQDKDARKESGAKVILATVEGDIHDIGKNMVSLMLVNNGFEVIDLGKNVPAADIIAAVKKTGARLVGLSALMTTTMGNMRKVVELARNEGLADVSFIVGGAVLDQNFADSIGAFYAADAMATVRLAQKLSGAK